jgi:hypothetical protein
MQEKKNQRTRIKKKRGADDIRQRRLKCAEGVNHWIDSAGIAFVSPADQDVIYKIDGVASLVWAKLPGSTIARTAASISRDLKIDAAQLERDCIDLTKKLLQLQILEFHSRSK